MKILVSGLTNIETTLRVDGFPVAYDPVRYPFFGVDSTVSGVGVNVARALCTLGAEVTLLTLTGRDDHHERVLRDLKRAGVPAEGVLDLLESTPQSVILYDPDGRRQIHVDLKAIQDTAYPEDVFRRALAGSDLAVLCNINFSRPFLAAAREAGVPVATDVHALADPDDAYNRDFMEAADILFLSHEHIPGDAGDFVRELRQRYRNRIIVVGMGGEGALLFEEERATFTHVPAVRTREIVNTIGAGDALFSAFVHEYVRIGDAGEALRRAVYFASWKIGEKGAACGFLTASGLDRLINNEPIRDES